MDNNDYNGKKILIADDNPDIIASLQLMLEGEGFKVESTLEGGKVGKMLQNHPDLLILDVMMSGHDGRQICKSIKSHESTRDIPVIMFSANRNIEESSRKAGANCFIAKPFEFNDLLQKVETHIN
ncbi:MAG TPA: response regulator transcription factor [Candidatus Limnocylindrales bacterium]|nr:response regulator transcription factor [Candidatus Limnocylindrales bacterium]